MGFRKRPRMSTGESKKLQRVELNQSNPFPPVPWKRNAVPVAEHFVNKDILPETQLMEGKRKPKPPKRPKPKTFYIKAGGTSKTR